MGGTQNATYAGSVGSESPHYWDSDMTGTSISYALVLSHTRRGKTFIQTEL